MKKYFKEKKVKSFYGKWINPVLLLYLLFVFLCFVTTAAVVFSLPDEQADAVGAICLFVALFMTLAGSAVVIFFIIPYLKKKQAMIDFARYDFKPYTSAGDEIFECDYHVCRYTVAASPFDEDTTTAFKSVESAKDFISQHFAQELLRMDDYYQGAEKSPFFIGYFFNGSDGVTVRIDKKTDGETTTLDLTERHCAVFTDEGLKLGEKLYTYPALDATLAAGFSKSTDFFVNVRLLIYLEGEGYLSFEISSRIAEIVKRFNIKITNPETLDYVLADPLRAFKQTALQLGLRKLK